MPSLDPVKLAALRSRVAGLSSAQKERLRAGLGAQGIAWSDICPAEEKAPTEERPDRLPLTPSQAQVWVLHQLYPELCAYHIAFAWHFEGSLEPAKVKKALSLLAARHEGLRTVFRQDEEGQPYQIVLPDGEVEFLIVEEADSDFVARPFDLASGSLARMELQCLGATEWRLRIVLHHLIADGWSRGILMKDFSRFYREGEVGEKEDLSQATFEVFQSDQRWRASDEAKDDLKYWIKNLEGFAPLELPCDRPRSSQASFGSATLTRTLPSHLRDAMVALGRETGASLFMVMLAAFKLLLHRHTGERDLSLGVPVAGRQHEKSRDLIGFFVNTLVMRTQLNLPPTATFADWVLRVKETVLGGLAHQFVPFSQVVEACAPDRTSHRNPLFEVMFQLQSDGYGLQNADAPEVGLPGVVLTQAPLPLPETKFDLTWHLFEREEGFLLAVEYRTSLFDEERIERLMGHFENLIGGLTATKPLTDLGWIGAEEKKTLIQHSQGRPAPIGKATFLEKFREQVKRNAKAVAIRCEEEELTYQELDDRSQRLAYQLRGRGVKRGSVIGVSLPRRPDLLIALLGIMKAGAAYLPIDPDLPLARREYLREDSGCLFVLDSIDEVSPVEGFSDLASSQENDLCYLLYTSGSTGRPKGVAVTHGSLMHYLEWALNTYPYEEGWGSPVQSSVGFDATITSLFGPLLAGKVVHLLPQVEVIEPLAALIQSGPGVVKITPAHLAAVEPFLATDLALERLPKALVIGGEALTSGHVAFWRSHYPQVRIFNEYGPTETVVGCCVHEMGEEDGEGAVSIGFPTAGTSLYILDEEFSLQAIGVPGELYIAGGGVAEGYRDRPALTAERFLPNPFAMNSSDQVMYRTGDRVVRSEDGSLRFLGRRDGQLQLRGYRIEPGEVEETLRRQPGVTEAAVVLRGGQLVAFVKGEASQDLRTALEVDLPSYMIPRVFRVMSELPLTVNGKVDREALPELEIPKAGSKIAPRTEDEATLLKVWQAVLAKEELGVEDNFFEQGGDSIMAMQIIAGARREGLRLTPALLFEHQTIASLARVAEVQTEEKAEIVSGEVPLSLLQKAFLESDQAEPGHFHQGLFLKINPALDRDRLEGALRIVVAYHDAFRLSFDAAFRQSYREEAGEVLFEVIELNDFSEIAQKQGPVDLLNGPLTRAALLQVGDEFRLWWQAHHLVVDGFSWRILLEDLEMAYCQMSEGKKVKLSPKTVSLAKWMKVEEAQSRPLSSALFENKPESRWTWANAEEKEWEVHCGDIGFKESEVLGALVQACGDFFRIEEIPVAVESHGRQGTLDVSRTVGWLTTIDPMLAFLPGTGLEATVKRVEEQLRKNQGAAIQPQLSFNFLGKLTMPAGELLLGLAPEDLPGLNDAENLRPYPLEVIAWISKDMLKIRWRWHRLALTETSIDQLGSRHKSLLESLGIRIPTTPKVPRKKEPRMSKLMEKLNSRRS